MAPNTSYILALEPHSCLPLAIPAVFAPDSPLLPAFLRGSVHGLASSVCFITPIIKQLWWGLGLRCVPSAATGAGSGLPSSCEAHSHPPQCAGGPVVCVRVCARRPVSRSFIQRCLSTGKSVVLCPGGVQECLYMDHHSETLFLTKRLGFVRMAMQHNVPLVRARSQWQRTIQPSSGVAQQSCLMHRARAQVPVFIFGQSQTYSWWRPGPDKFIRWFSRQVRCLSRAPV